jgi:hypothetical protein
MANETIEDHEKLTTAQLINRSESRPIDMAECSTTRTVMFPRSETESFRNRWNDIQADFVDSPRKKLMSWSLLLSSDSPRSFPPDRKSSRAIGARGATFQRRTFVKHSAATGPSSIVCSLSNSLDLKIPSVRYSV